MSEPRVMTLRCWGHSWMTRTKERDFGQKRAYRSSLIESVLEILKFLSHINERAYRNRPLTEKQIEANRERSKVRAKVEHVFGHWVNSMGGKLMRSIGKQSVKATVGLKNLVYNLKRYVFWEGQNEQLVG